MAVSYKSNARFQGISTFLKESLIPDQIAYSRSVDWRTDPRSITLLPMTVKESGTTVVDLVKWASIIPTSLVTYMYGNAGYIYSRSTGGTYVNLHQAPSSHGNGLQYFQGDDYLYYTTDNTIGRYGPISQASPQFSDDFLRAAGGVPTNTYSLSTVAASSQYVDRADTASLSITGDLTLEAFFKATTLPAVGSSMALVAKWDESANTRSYIMDILGVSGFFGDGSDSSLTISSNTTQAPVDSVCSGTSGTNALTATNVSFTAGQVILIHQSRGTGAGTNQQTKIQAYTAGTITTADNLNFSYNSTGSNAAQVIVLKQYTNVTVNVGITWTAKSWNEGTGLGGILAFLANGTVTINGTIEGDGLFQHSSVGIGYVGGQGGVNGTNFREGYQGEGTAGPDGNTGGPGNNAANGSGGGGGGTSADVGNGGGGGGGNATVGGVGGNVGGAGGLASGATDLTTMTFGGGGGGGGNAGDSSSGGNGGNGGGIILISGVTLTMGGSGIIRVDGHSGQNGTGGNANGGGGGAGGSILMNVQTATLGTAQITANHGTAGTGSGSGAAGGDGSDGRIHINYLTSYTGTTSPTIDATLDSALSSSAGYNARLGISNNGTAFEYLSKLIPISTGSWYRLSISWKAATSTATFYLNAVSQGTVVGTKTAISDNASRFYVGANKGASAVQNFFNGLLDDVRVWSVVRTATDIFNYNLTQLVGTEGMLNAYYEFNNALTDLTANANTLTNENTCTFVVDVPFSGATTRLDIDQSASHTGHTYTTPITIIEDAVDELSFTPTKDPQKSIQFNVVAKGTGDVTVTIHDQQNRTIATQTITAGNMGTGLVEWIFSSVWRPLLGRSYHAHLTSTVNDTTVQTGTDNDLSAATYTTYFQFLVNDGDFHPIALMLNFLAIGNERYIATWDGVSYNPNAITFPPGWRVRCFALWNEYLAVGMWRGSHIYDIEQGRIYFWNGIDSTFDFYLDTPEGAVNAMLGAKGTIEFFAGYQGDLMQYTYGAQAQKLKRLPQSQPNKYVEVFPGAMTMYHAYLHFGIAGNTDSTYIEKGAYSWGSVDSSYPPGLSYDYPISTGNRTATNVKIGMITAIQRQLLIGWQDNVSYGVDNVSPTNSPFTSGSIDFLIQDNGQIWKDETAQILRGDFLPLTSGQTVNVRYQFNRDGTWINFLDTETNVVGDTTANLSVSGNGNNREYQLGFDLGTNTTTGPTFLGLSLQEDDQAESSSFAGVGNYD